MEKESAEREVRVVLYGVGAIGSGIARLILRKTGLKIVGAIDAASGKVGRDLGEVIGQGEPLGIEVSSDPDRLLSAVKADVAVHATSSFLKDIYSQLVELIQHGVNVVSTCEELSYPYFSDPNLAAELDRLAKEHGVTVLGTGINPGFLMDVLPLTLTCICQEIQQIKVERVMDAATRRMPFQKKIGIGLTPEEFKRRIESGQITGHVGLGQSVAMMADALGWDLQSVEIGPVEPVISQKPVESKDIRIEIGQVAGLRQFAHGILRGKQVITLVFKAYVGAEEEYDLIAIEGTPSIREKITPCVHGDLGTAAIIVNSIPRVINAEPGLKTMKDLPMPSAVLGDIRQHLKTEKDHSSHS